MTAASSVDVSDVFVAECVVPALTEWLGEVPGNVATISTRSSKGVDLAEVAVQRVDGTVVEVVAKRYRPEVADPRVRPALSRADDRLAKPRTEWDGLVALHEVEPLDSVEPLYFVAAEQLLLIERFDGPDLRSVILSNDASAEDVVVRSAELMARFHGLAGGHDLRSTPEQVNATFEELRTFTADACGRRLSTALVGWWKERWPDRLTLGLGHGDCAPRNLVTSTDGRVAVIDGIARNRLPVLEDIATFTTSIRVRHRLRGRGPAKPLDGVFARAYGDARPDVDLADLDPFEVLVLLDRLAATTTRSRQWKDVVVRRLVISEIRRLVGVRTT